MTLHDRDPVLRRKLTLRSSARSADAAAPSGPAGTLVRAFSRALSAAAPLVAEDAELHRRSATLAELLDTIDPASFVTVLDGAGAPGLVVLDQSGFVTLIEAMTIGRLGPRPPGARRPTPTDAALLGAVVDASLANLAADDTASQLRAGRSVPDHRLLSVLLDDGAFDLVALTARLVSGAVDRPLQLMLAIPRTEEPIGEQAVAPDLTTDWTQALTESVLLSPARLRAELGRVTLTLADALELGVGSVLSLPLSNLEEVRLVALDGAEQAVGRLGQSRGMRAVRLTAWPNGQPPEPQMVDAMPPARGLAPTGLQPEEGDQP